MRSPPDRHRRLHEIFDEALLVDASMRDAYLDEACADDPHLRAHVVRLLAAHEDGSSWLDRPLDLLSRTPDAGEFAGTERFAVVRQLGAGGMGAVYEVHDRLRDERVAMKTLRRSGAADLYRLKREFRGLADVTHPNLVCLYELFVDGDQSFFTMELINGVSFVEYARGRDDTQCSIERLVPALQQLIDGVSELHRRGKLHRDIKPSNVLITTEGRVLILDFGLLAEAATLHSSEWIGGTPAYMSPEETSGGKPSEASDWYAVGVTLYEALTGTLPFAGSVANVLWRKRESDPIPPLDAAPGNIPRQLSDICMGLLRRAPADRLTGAAAMLALTRDAMTPAPIAASQDMPFVGRQRQLAVLHGAREAVATGEARSVIVYGPSGIGKSALVRRFLSQLPHDDVVVLAGRCYETESVPYKALDGVVDELSRYLGSVPGEDVARQLPRDVSALTRVFPVLLQVSAVAEAAARERSAGMPPSDPLSVRRRAIEILHALLAAVARSHVLVIWIDDLQWADADSMMLLEDLLGPPHPAPMLTLLSFRQEEIASKPFLQALLDRTGRREWPTLMVEPMGDDEARALLRSLLSGRQTLTDDEQRRMTREARGSPFVLEQLTLYTAGASASAESPPTFAGMFESRLNALPRQDRLFLETLAICGRPVAPDVICDACGVVRERQSIVVRLRASRLIRSSGSSDRIETYHDRIREVVAERLAPATVREIHGHMAASLVARQSDDCESLFEHYRGAGDLQRASTQAERAAERASASLAFDRAASFYRHAIDLAPSAVRVAEWRERLALALANAGRPAEAAEAYLIAATGTTHARHVELQRRAAEQFLAGGHIDRGLGLMRQVLEDVGLHSARSPRTAALWLVWRRARLLWRGVRFERRHAGDIDPEVLLRLDTSWAVATGLALVDILSASNFIAQHLHMALDAGEPSRIVRGAALEWAARNADWPFRKGSARLHRFSTDLAQSAGTPHAIAMVALADSVTASATGQWKRALMSSERALTILREQCVGVTWEMNIAQNIFIWALMYLGELGEVSRRVPALLEDARRRGNLYLATELCTRSNYVWLAADDPDSGEREATEAVARWSQKGFHRQHYSAMLARVQTALYRGDGWTAWRLLEDRQVDLRRSMLLRVQALRIETLYLRARSAIAIASTGPSHHHFLAIARRYARRIAREQMPWSDPLALLMHAGITSVEGRREAAVAHLEEAAGQFERADMMLYLAVTKRRCGGARGDERGRQLQREAESWMAAQQIKNPICLTRMLAPGFPD